MADSQVKLPDSVADELFRAAKRTTEEVVRLTDRTMHDGTACVLIPEGIFNRLERAVLFAREHTQDDWRP